MTESKSSRDDTKSSHDDTMSCDQVEDVLPELLDGFVSEDQLDEILHHISVCDACTFTKGQYDSMQALYRDHGALKLPDDARSRIRSALDT